MSVQAMIEQIAKETSATIGVYFKRLDTGETVTYNPGHIFPAASVIKCCGSRCLSANQPNCMALTERSE